MVDMKNEPVIIRKGPVSKKYLKGTKGIKKQKVGEEKLN